MKMLQEVQESLEKREEKKEEEAVKVSGLESGAKASLTVEDRALEAVGPCPPITTIKTVGTKKEESLADILRKRKKLKEAPESGTKKPSKKPGKKEDSKVEAEGIKQMQKMMKSWTQGKKEDIPEKTSIKDKIKKFNNLNAGKEASYGSLKASRQVGGRKRKVEDDKVNSTGLKRANIMTGTGTELQQESGIDFKLKNVKINDIFKLASSTKDGGGIVRAGAASVHGGNNSGAPGACARTQIDRDTGLGDNSESLRKHRDREPASVGK